MDKKTLAPILKKILNKDIMNYKISNVNGKPKFCYPFELSFNSKLTSTQIERIFEEVFAKYGSGLQWKPEYELRKFVKGDKTYVIYIYTSKPEEIAKLRSQIISDIMKLYETALISEKG